MGCTNLKTQSSYKTKKQEFQLKYQKSTNPIIRIAKQWNIDLIREKWEDNEEIVIKAKLGTQKQDISKGQFLSLLPSLCKFSPKTQINLYQLFNYEENNSITLNNFIIVQIIILKSDQYDLLADMFFWVYCDSSSKKFLNQEDYGTFARQLKQYQLEFLHQTKKPNKKQTGEMEVSRLQFRQIFEQYDINSIKQLFRFDLREEELKLLKFLSKNGINRKNQIQVFLVQFQWFLKWKNYMEHKYGIKIEVKQNGKNIDRNKQKLLIFNNNQKQVKREFTEQENQTNSQFLESVNNDRIQGEEANELKQNFVEFSDFVSVPIEIWDQIRIIYGGGPAISKPYPHFYNKKIFFVIFDHSKLEFQSGFTKNLSYNPKQTFQQIYKARQQKYFLYFSVNELIAYFKHPGELQWKKIKDLSIKIEAFPFQYRAFLVFVKSNYSQKFEEKFNVTMHRDKKQIKEKIKNYGNMLNLHHDGILQQGYVGGVLERSVLIYLKTAKGQYTKVLCRCNELEKLNPKTLEENYLQGFAGLQNIGNTCYINAPLQCLLKTPYFDQYLESFHGDKTRNMLTYQLKKVSESSKNSSDCVSMEEFKKVFDEMFPFFQGQAQHDAQQFLLLLLDKISQEQPRQSLINSQFAKENKKIHKFFSGKTRAETSCKKCSNKGHNDQSFFTYSLSLPVINEVPFYFYFVDEEFRSKKYGVTIKMDCTVEEMIYIIETELQIRKQNLLIMSVSQGQWINSLKRLNPSYKITKFEHFDSAVVCYPIKMEETPEYEELIEGKAKKTIKIQIRNRVIDLKKKTFKSIRFPFFIEISSETTGRSLKHSIISKIKKFFNEEEFQDFKDIQEDWDEEKLKTVSPSSFQTFALLNSKQNLMQEKNNDKSSLASKQKINDLPFKIRYLKNEDGLKQVCWFCKKSIKNSTKINTSTDCSSCEFDDNQTLFESKQFIKGFKKLLISIDWKTNDILNRWTIEQTKSLFLTQNQDKSRKKDLQALLKENYHQQESIELKCEKPSCQHPFAIRQQIIIQAPQILILHLKRFYYKENTFHKLKNKIIIPQELTLPGFSDKYEFYGNVVHSGSGTGRGGHYINYVKAKGRWYKCDDEKVQFTKDSNEHLDPNAYLLFYAKSKIGPSWSIFGI